MAEGVVQFGANGYRHTSLASIARNIGLTPAAAYPYFATKHELFLASADAAVAALIDGADQSASGSALPWLMRFRSIVDQVPHHPLVERILKDEDPELVRQCLELPALRQFIERLRATVDDAQRQRFIRSDIGSDVLATALETIFLGQLLFRVRSGTQELDHRAAAVGSLLATLLVTVDPQPSVPVPKRAR